MIVGAALPLPVANATGPTLKSLANCAVFLQGGRKEIRIKTLLPFYDVFMESRYFEPAPSFGPEYSGPIECNGKKLGIVICEDSWTEQTLLDRKIHKHNPSAKLKEQGSQILINISASPFDAKKKSARRQTIIDAARAVGLPIAYVNHFGAQDEIIFDGDAFLYDGAGELLANKLELNGDVLHIDLDRTKPITEKKIANLELQSLEAALVLGLRDYAKKNGFSRFVLGLSGGIDSAVVACLAVRALGPENVFGIAMPSKYSSSHSIEDAEELAANLKIKLFHVPIKMPHSTVQMSLKSAFPDGLQGLTDENLQSRLRGITVMAFANQLDALALATGNKSELAMGYSTLYGDLCGAVAPIGDLYKRDVYALASFINQARHLIPERTITKAPSAELRPNQVDQDSLPPYPLLDAALELLIEQELSPAATLTKLAREFPNLDLTLLESIERKIRFSEYKRSQAPVVLKVSAKAFGSGRRYPITSFF